MRLLSIVWFCILLNLCLSMFSLLVSQGLMCTGYSSLISLPIDQNLSETLNTWLESWQKLFNTGFDLGLLFSNILLTFSLAIQMLLATVSFIPNVLELIGCPTALANVLKVAILILTFWFVLQFVTNRSMKIYDS